MWVHLILKMLGKFCPIIMHMFWLPGNIVGFYGYSNVAGNDRVPFEKLAVLTSFEIRQNSPRLDLPRNLLF